MSTIVITRVAPRPIRPIGAVRPRTGELRLTARGRLVLFVVGLLAALAAAVYLGAASAATERPEPVQVVQVGPGDTLWGIASELTPEGGDVRATMEHVRDLNSLESSSLQVGQQIVVPQSR